MSPKTGVSCHSKERGSRDPRETGHETRPLLHLVAMTLICLSQYVSQVKVHPIRMAFTMYACQGGGSKLPSLKVLYKD